MSRNGYDHDDIYFRLGVFVAIVVLLAIGLHALFGAPAPLPRRGGPAPMPAPPEVCTMTWGAIEYSTLFMADGRYNATTTNGETIWRGGWVVRYSLEGIVTLYVRETTSADDATAHWVEWFVPLGNALAGNGKTPAGIEIKITRRLGRPDS